MSLVRTVCVYQTEVIGGFVENVPGSQRWALGPQITPRHIQKAS